MNSRFRTLAVSAIAMILSGASAGHAEGDGKRSVSPEKMEKWHQKKMERIKSQDKNGDGVIDKAEFMNAAEQRFAKWDEDGDGKIVIKDIEEKHKKRMEEKAAKKKEIESTRPEAGDDVDRGGL